jgi:hypothetical protein
VIPHLDLTSGLPINWHPINRLPINRHPIHNNTNLADFGKKFKDTQQCTQLARGKGPASFPTCMSERGYDNATISALDIFAKQAANAPIAKCEWRNRKLLEFHIDFNKNWTETQFGENGATLEKKLQDCDVKEFHFQKVDNSTVFPNKALLKVEKKSDSVFFTEEVNCVTHAIWDARPTERRTRNKHFFCQRRP